jgi:hypothetical protein
MPSLKFKDTKLLQIDNRNIQHEILVIDKKYLDDGSIRFHVGMKDIYFITSANLGIYKKEFHIAMFENPKFPYFLPRIPKLIEPKNSFWHLPQCSHQIDSIYEAYQNVVLKV